MQIKKERQREEKDQHNRRIKVYIDASQERETMSRERPKQQKD
jgi:hypothetical protein